MDSMAVRCPRDSSYWQLIVIIASLSDQDHGNGRSTVTSEPIDLLASLEDPKPIASYSGKESELLHQVSEVRLPSSPRVGDDTEAVVRQGYCPRNILITESLA